MIVDHLSSYIYICFINKIIKFISMWNLCWKKHVGTTLDIDTSLPVMLLSHKDAVFGYLLSSGIHGTY